jgi:hypothetical protein
MGLGESRNLKAEIWAPLSLEFGGQILGLWSLVLGRPVGRWVGTSADCKGERRMSNGAWLREPPNSDDADFADRMISPKRQQPKAKRLGLYFAVRAVSKGGVSSLEGISGQTPEQLNELLALATGHLQHVFGYRAVQNIAVAHGLFST